MISEIRHTARFRKSVRRCQKKHKDLDALFDVIDRIQKGEKLSKRYRLHPLKGNYQGFYECHIESDWLLLYYIEGDVLVLVDTGSHRELLKR